MVAEFEYVNENGLRCFATLVNAGDTHHCWWSSRRNIMGKYEKHEVTVFEAFLRKLKNCTKVRVKVRYEDK